MDKKFVMGIAAMAALTLVSCSSDDLDSFSDNSSKNEAISFDGYLGRSAVAVNGTRGSVLDKDALQNSTEGFGVFGHYKEADGQEFGHDLFNNQQVTYKSAWTYSPLKFWPTQGHIDFLAYAPYDSKYVNKVSSDNQKIDFTVNSTIKNQKDLLWANNAVNQTKNNISGTGNKVTFHFKHALSRLGYSVKLYGDYTSNKVKFTLKEISLAGSDPKSTTASTTEPAKKAFYTDGTIDLSTGTWEKHSAGASKQDFINWFSEPQDVTSATESSPYKNPTSDYLFVIPQNFSAKIEGAENPDKLYVIVTYTIEYTDHSAASITNKVYKQITPNFVQGKAYTLNLTIGLPIEFDVDVVEDWKAPDDGTGNINIGSDDTPWER